MASNKVNDNTTEKKTAWHTCSVFMDKICKIAVIMLVPTADKNKNFYLFILNKL